MLKRLCSLLPLLPVVAFAGEAVVEDAAARAALPEFQVIPAATTAELTPAQGWPTTEQLAGWTRSLGGDTSARYSSLTQISAANVKDLQVAWTYHAGTGTEIGKSDVGLAKAGGFEVPGRRGLLYWPGDGTHAPRIIFPGGRAAVAIDAKSGKLVESFGQGGRVPMPAGATAGGAVWQNVLIMPGYDRDIYGMDVVSGKLLWTFKTIAEAGGTGGDTW